MLTGDGKKNKETLHLYTKNGWHTNSSCVRIHFSETANYCNESPLWVTLFFEHKAHQYTVVKLSWKDRLSFIWNTCYSNIKYGDTFFGWRLPVKTMCYDLVPKRDEVKSELTALPVMVAISFSFANTADTISLGGVNIIRWVLRLDCRGGRRECGQGKSVTNRRREKVRRREAGGEKKREKRKERKEKEES